MIIHYLRACFSTDPALIEGKSLRSPGRANEDNRKDAPEARGWGAGGGQEGTPGLEEVTGQRPEDLKEMEEV